MYLNDAARLQDANAVRRNRNFNFYIKNESILEINAFRIELNVSLIECCKLKQKCHFPIKKKRRLLLKIVIFRGSFTFLN